MRCKVTGEPFGNFMMMKKFKVSVQIDFYSEPYECYMVYAYDTKDAVARVAQTLPKYVGHRFLNAKPV